MDDLRELKLLSMAFRHTGDYRIIDIILISFRFVQYVAFPRKCGLRRKTTQFTLKASRKLGPESKSCAALNGKDM